MKYQIVTIEKESDKVGSVLKQTGQEVTFPLSDEDKTLIQDMKDLLYKFEGVGLAAPQIGVSKKIAVIYIPPHASILREDSRTYDMHVIINPNYQGVDAVDVRADMEACYSVEDVAGKVPRFHTIKLKYQDEAGAIIEKMVDGFYARVLQHEIDHLDGLLITDRLTGGCVFGPKAEMMKLRRDELSPEKRDLFDEWVRKKESLTKEK